MTTPTDRPTEAEFVDALAWHCRASRASKGAHTEGVASKEHSAAEARLFDLFRRALAAPTVAGALDGECYHCGEQTNAIAADPGVWPVTHHERCLRALSQPAVPASEALLAEFEACLAIEPPEPPGWMDRDVMMRQHIEERAKTLRNALAAEKARRGEPA